MSQIGPNPAKTANAQVNPTPALGWEVFVTPAYPSLLPTGPLAYTRHSPQNLWYEVGNNLGPIAAKNPHKP